MSEQAALAVSVRALSGGREWQVPDDGGGLTALTAKRYLVAHGGFDALAELFLLAGTRSLRNHENVRAVLAETNENELTLVVCEPSWLADDRVILAGKWLRAVCAGTLCPRDRANYDRAWAAARAAEVGADDLQSLLQSAYSLGEGSGIAAQEVSVREFLTLLGSEMRLLQQSHLLQPIACSQLLGIERAPLALARCAVLWALACSAPCTSRVSFPLLLPARAADPSLRGPTLLRPPGCDLRECLRPRVHDAICGTGSDFVMELEGVSRAQLIERAGGQPRGSLDWISPEAHTTVAALRVCARVQARLPVVLLGDFAKCEDVALCDLAGHLLFCLADGPVLSDHEVSGLDADYRLPTEERGPLTLLRARGAAQDIARLAHLVATAGCWSPRTVWSVSIRGTTRQQVLSLLPQNLGEAALIEP